MSERLQWAKWFIDHGFAIFPIAPGTKISVIKGWEKYSTTPLTDEEKKQYLEMIEKGYNYAVPGGQKNLVILDFENKELLKSWISEDELNKLCSKTLCVDTPHGGLHVYVTADDIPEHKFNPVFTKDGKGIADLQSFSSYVLGPESCINHKHCNTDKCPWKGQDYTTCYIPLNNNEIMKADLKGLLRFLAEKGKKLGIELSSSARGWVGGKKKDGQKNTEDKEYEELIAELKKKNRFKSVEEAKNEICEKLKHDSVEYKVICEGKTYADVGIDRSRGDFRVIKTLLYHGLRDPDLILQVLPEDSKAKNNEKWDSRKYFLVTLKNAWSVVSKYLEAKKVSEKDKSKAKQIMIEAIAEEITREHRLVTFKGRDQVKEWVIGLFRFSKKKGIYEPFDVTIEEVINNKLEEYKDFPLGSDKSRVVRNIKEEIMRRTLIPLVKEPMRIAFRNGTLEWNEKGIIWYDTKERTPRVYAFHYIPWNVKIDEIMRFERKEITVQDIEELASRLCPRAFEVFKQWVDDKWVLLFEIIGYTLYPRYDFNKAILLVGNGSDGKTTFLNLLLTILGKDNVSAVSLKRIMEGDKFASIELYHKLANISAELFAFRVTNTDIFKKLTGGDYIEGQKKFKDPIYFINYAKLINSTNELPIVKDQTYGFWRRWLAIEFPHQFKIEPFFNKVFTKDEIEGIITVAILAFARVIQQKKFDFEDSSADIKEKWERASDSVYAFIKDLIESGKVEYDPKNGDLFVSVKKLYSMYTEWCDENEKTPEPQSTFTKRLESRFRIVKQRKRIGGERDWCYVGIKLKEDNTGGNDSVGVSNSLIELYSQYKGKVRSMKDLQDELGLRAFELLDWCEKRNLCRWIDEEHMEFS
ncbi:DNA primase, phage associated [Saccharolobus shibatae B12]|uniref:DNA primase, phage associated n=1 Tax=Saccharolobus shibatae (strain ATCC 51178 / DSM 5389 / JCM 8931 / NBRC 15437 / B12) TaxID=523848 RepID=A0A8F5BR05_SACSH|nr:phage/plasmid primase, P4 family [Saccharolobus shibatae]QXJ29740.1 DNA primase, phage associated [Saccharolobus shibatae B12]